MWGSAILNIGWQIVDDGGEMGVAEQETVRYNYRLRVSKKNSTWLWSEWHKARWVWNRCVDVFQRNAGKPKDEREPVSAVALSGYLTQARSRISWLREGSSVAQQQMTRNYAQSLSQSFKVKGKGRPRHKSRKRQLPTLEFTRRGFSIGEKNEHGNYTLRLPGKHRVTIVTSRDLPSDPSSARISLRPDGHWYASFVVVRDREELEPTGNAIGIDWGVKQTAITTDDDLDIDYQGFAKSEAKALRRLDQMMARRRPKPGQKASRGYRNAKHQRAKLFQKITNRRKDYATKWARRMVERNDVIAIEDFKSGFVNRNRSLARKSHDAAIGQLKMALANKAESTGRMVVNVPPAYTTMMCSNCGAINKRLGLGQRVFECQHCCFVLDRDKNAARNIRAIGCAMLDIEYPPGGADPGTGVDEVSLRSLRVSERSEPGISGL